MEEATELLTLTQIASRLEISERTAARWIASGKLQARKTARGRYVVSKRSLEALTSKEERDIVLSRLSAAEYRLRALERQITDQAAQIADLLEQSQASNRPRTARKQQAEAADQDGITELPANLVGATEFAELHSINPGTAKSAYQAGRIATRRGKWRGPGRNPIAIALDAEGRAQFYEIYSGSRDFKACQNCPHTTAKVPE